MIDVATIKASLADPREVARRLGLDKGAIRQAGGGITVFCPFPGHDERTPSCSLFVAGGVLRVHCHGCGQRGDVLTLIAVIFGASLTGHFPEVLQHAAALAGIDPESSPPPRARRPAPQPRTPPPIEEVRQLLAQGAPPDEDNEVARWLRSRGLDPRACRRFARALRSTWPRWARSGEPPRPWAASGHRLLVPVYDSLGASRSVRARSVRGSRPKELPPNGHLAGGFVFANGPATKLLAGTPPHDGWMRARVLIVEGSPDFLTWATRLRVDPAHEDWAVLGLPGSGSWTAELAARIPDEAMVVIRTDRDDAGDRYATMIARELTARCLVLWSDAEGRWRRDLARAAALAAGRTGGSGERGLDENDLLRAGRLPRHPADGCTIANPPREPA